MSIMLLFIVKSLDAIHFTLNSMPLSNFTGNCVMPLDNKYIVI